MKTLILTKYYGPTDHKGSRIKCQSCKGVTWHQFDYGARCPHEAAAREHAAKNALSNPFEITGIDGGAFVCLPA